MPPFLTTPALIHPAIAHGFFGRQGGVSSGIYSSLNVGYASGDTPENVTANRALIKKTLGAAHLQTVYQIHSADVVTITEPTGDNHPRADGLVTTVPGIALGVLAADCNPILFADAEAGVIGACHAGWKGAVSGVALATIKAMQDLGARRITAALGPAIQQKSYEVGEELRAAFMEQTPANHEFFMAKNNGKFLFDLPGYLERQLEQAGLTVDRLFDDTYSQPEVYYSYRRTTHLNEPDYGRQMSAIMLRG